MIELIQSEFPTMSFKFVPLGELTLNPLKIDENCVILRLRMDRKFSALDS